MLPISPISAFLGMLLGFLISAILLISLRNKLPQDHGRAYAINGEISKGKARGSGVIFIPIFTVLSIVIVPFSLERAAYLILTLAAMLTGYLDDKSDKPWGELKKGLLDLVISMLTLITFMSSHRSFSFSVFGHIIPLPWWMFAPIALFVLWAFINCCNCADGVDGHFGSLAVIALGSLGYVLHGFCNGNDWAICSLILIGCILAYLLFNASPSLIMMGDAGSRAIGLFMGILLMQTGNLLLCLPFTIIILLDGGLGLLKLAVMRTFKTKKFMANLRTPIHDEARKERKWSDTQTVFRFAIVQLICAITGILMMYAIH